METATDLALIPAELIKAVDGTTLAVEGRTTLRDAFAPHFIKFHELAEAAKLIAVNNPDDARKARLALKAVRVACEKTRKGLKDDILIRGRAIDSINAILETQITPIEAQLEHIEKAEEIAAAERKAALKKEREEALEPYGLNTNFYPLGEMDAESFGQLLNDTRLAHETRAEAARVAEAKRLADEAKAEADRVEAARVAAVETERVRVENERLKQEAAAREAAAKIERDRAEAERAEIQRKADEAAAQADKERLELEAKLTAERAERERIAAEQKAKDDAEAARAEAARVAEAAALAVEREKAHKAAAAPDREKLAAWVDRLRELTLPEMATREGELIAIEVAARRNELVKWIEEEAAALYNPPIP